MFIMADKHGKLVLKSTTVNKILVGSVCINFIGVCARSHKCGVSQHGKFFHHDSLQFSL